MSFIDHMTPLAIKLYRNPLTRAIIQKTAIGSLATKAYYQTMLYFQDMPRFYNIEFTNHCNMRCVMCKNSSIIKEKKSFIAPKIVQKFIDEIDTLGSVWIMLVKQGDALIHPQFSDLLQILRSGKNRHTITLTTNALALNKKRRDAILDNELDYVNVSIDSLEPATYKSIRGAPLKPVLKNVEALQRAIRERKAKTKISVNMVILSSNGNEIEEAKHYWAKRGIFLTLQKANGWIEDSLEKGNKEWTNSNVGISRYPCQSPFLNPVINANGTVSLCCTDWDNSAVLGDFKTQSMKNIWHNEAYKTVRQQHLANDYSKLPLCKDCPQWQAQPNIFFPWQYNRKHIK